MSAKSDSAINIATRGRRPVQSIYHASKKELMGLSNFTRAYPNTPRLSGDAIVIAIAASGIMVKQTASDAVLPGSADFGDEDFASSSVNLGDVAGKPVLALDLPPTTQTAETLTPVPLRDLYALLSDDEYALAGYAAQIIHWRKTSRHCPVCGHETVAQGHDWGARCPNCEHTSYPRVSPAVLILIHDDHRILLAHKPGWGPRYSILAGFVEPGESLEECVRRETAEESGVSLTDIAYVNSQPWPFPHQLMIGFTARYAGGEIAIDHDELDDARWFTVDELPDLPGPVSLSRRLIDRWVASKRQ